MKDVFCMIIAREIPSAKVYEDDEVLAFLDISQATKGHTLVVPKEHYENFLECPKELMNKVMDVAQRIGNAQKKALGASGVNILTNVGESAGQTVKHFHVHVMPRFDDYKDGLEIIMKEQDDAKKDLAGLAQKISSEIK